MGPAPDPPNQPTPPTRIRQVLANLLSNAVKFTPQGPVSVSIEVVDDRPARRRPAALTVRDTGVGFDAAAGEALFQRFSQADSTITRRFGGTGLGLSICRSLVEMMGGEIAARVRRRARAAVSPSTSPCPAPVLSRP